MPYNNVPKPELISKSAAVLEAYTPDVHERLVALIPNPKDLNEAHERLEASYASSLKGDPEKVKACEEDGLAVSQCLAILHAVAKVAKDPALMDRLRLGQETVKAMPGDAMPGAPKEVRILFDKKGRPYISFAKISNAKGYEVWVCDGDPSVEANWRFLVWCTKCKKIALPGLNRIKTNFFKIRGMRNDIGGPWSAFISLDPV